MADVIDRTARQVRLPGGEVHDLTGHDFDRMTGHTYRTGCGQTLRKEQGATRTTRHTTCRHCLHPRRLTTELEWLL